MLTAQFKIFTDRRFGLNGTSQRWRSYFENALMEGRSFNWISVLVRRVNKRFAVNHTRNTKVLQQLSENPIPKGQKTKKKKYINSSDSKLIWIIKNTIYFVLKCKTIIIIDWKLFVRQNCVIFVWQVYKIVFFEQLF